MITERQNLFVRILKDNWGAFKSKHPSYANEYYDGIIQKVVNCGDPSFGYIKYQCLWCGVGTKVIGMSCKTRFCLRCSRLVAADFVAEVQSKLHVGVIYRHLILTLPEQLWSLFYEQRRERPGWIRRFKVF